MDTAEDYAALLAHLGLPCYPNLAQCANLMAKYKAPPEIISHCEQVASVALALAHQMDARKAATVDANLLESACLLHDICKGTHGQRSVSSGQMTAASGQRTAIGKIGTCDEARVGAGAGNAGGGIVGALRATPSGADDAGIGSGKSVGGHAREGMELLLREGYPKAAMLVGGHMDLPGGIANSIGEMELLYLADKLCRRGRIVALEDTMREISSRFPPDSEAHAHAISRISIAQEILRRVEC
jgi:putative nucleotidyltransferase with HDIG domain